LCQVGCETLASNLSWKMHAVTLPANETSAVPLSLTD